MFHFEHWKLLTRVLKSIYCPSEITTWRRYGNIMSDSLFPVFDVMCSLWKMLPQNICLQICGKLYCTIFWEEGNTRAQAVFNTTFTGGLHCYSQSCNWKYLVSDSVIIFQMIIENDNVTSEFWNWWLYPELSW
jgi:hypothetical protein